MPKVEPIAITRRGQMLLSRKTIRKTDLATWRETVRILVSEVNDPRHVPGFAWKADREGYVVSAVIAIIHDRCR